jgi:hypothetical protein
MQKLVSGLWSGLLALGRIFSVAVLIASAWQLYLYIEATFVPYHQMQNSAYTDLLATASILSVYSQVNNTVDFFPDQPSGEGWQDKRRMFEDFRTVLRGQAMAFADARVIKAGEGFEEAIYCRTKNAKRGDTHQDPANVKHVAGAMNNLRFCIKWSVLSRFDPERGTTSRECDDNFDTKCR